MPPTITKKEYESLDHSSVAGYWTKIAACILSKDKRLNDKAYVYFVEACLKSKRK